MDKHDSILQGRPEFAHIKKTTRGAGEIASSPALASSQLFQGRGPESKVCRSGVSAASTMVSSLSLGARPEPRPHQASPMPQPHRTCAWHEPRRCVLAP